MMKKLMAMLLIAVLSVGQLGCVGLAEAQETAREAIYDLDDLTGTWVFASAVMADGTSLNPIEYAVANEIPQEILAEGIALIMKLAFDEEGKVTESVNDEYFYNGTYTFDGKNMVSVAMEDGRTMEAEMADIYLEGELTTTLAIVDNGVVFLYAQID